MKKFILTITTILFMFAGIAIAADGDPVLEGKTATGNIITTGVFEAGTAATVPGAITLFDEGILTFYDNEDDTSVIIGPVADGTTTLGITGSLNTSGNVAGATYGSDATISDADLLSIDDGATTTIAVGGGVGSPIAWTTATGSGAPARAGSPTFTTQITTPIIALTGGQIAFPATAVPSANANTLDDYQEGTWTPSLGGDATYTNQQGYFTKIGNVVYIIGRLQVNVIGTGSTSTISGLPFAVKSVGFSQPFSVGYYASLATNVIHIAGNFHDNSSTLAFVTSAASSATCTNNAAIFGNTTNIQFAGSYMTE